jgi:GntR family phosphonate transport system transcriptional regulator
MRAVYGCEHIRRTPEVAARLVRPDDAKLLKVSLNQPILLVQSVNVNEDGDVTEYRINRFRGDSMELVLGE